MAFTEEEVSDAIIAIEEVIWSRRRPPHHLRNQGCEAQRISGQSLELFFIRPHFQNQAETVEESIAKITFVRKRGIWRLFWQRADLKWHGYKPDPVHGSLREALEVIYRDEYCCFFG